MGVAIAGANKNDHLLVEETLDARVLTPPPDLPEWFQNLCLDKGYDQEKTRDLVIDYGIVPCVRSRGEEAEDIRRVPKYRARRWVVERTHSWMNRFRRLLIRWEKKAANHLGFIQFACALITLGAIGVFG